MKMDKEFKKELINTIEESLCMWNLVHEEEYDVSLSDEVFAGYDGEVWRRLKLSLEKLKAIDNT
jgi:hypothetical protein